MMSDFLFRRQFVLCRVPDLPLPGWHVYRVGDVYLYAHSTLQVAEGRSGAQHVLLLGYAFDPEEPAAGNETIAQRLAGHEAFEGCCTATFRYTGTFAVLYHTPEKTKLFHDAAGLREVYYTSQDGGWVASQPALLQRFLVLKALDDAAAQAFFTSPAFKKSGALWAGEQTEYAGVRHLLPNHYLDVRTGTAHRYWPTEPLGETPVDEAATWAAAYLKGAMEAASRRHTLSLGLSAGWDSRVLLAASRAHREQLSYFVVDHGRGPGRKKQSASNAVDVKIARRLSERLDLSLSIHTYSDVVDPSFREAYLQSITRGREAGIPMLYHVFLKNHPAEMTVNGNVSEIARQYFEPDPHLDPRRLAFLIYQTEDMYVVETYARWLDEAVPLCTAYGYEVLDLFYWEERMGNWAARRRSEAQLASDVFSPFNSRDLLRLLLSVDRRARDPEDNQLYRAILRLLWPETLEEPFNPRLKLKGIRLMRRLGIYPAYRALRRRLLAGRASG